MLKLERAETGQQYHNISLPQPCTVLPSRLIPFHPPIVPSLVDPLSVPRLSRGLPISAPPATRPAPSRPPLALFLLGAHEQAPALHVFVAEKMH